MIVQRIIPTDTPTASIIASTAEDLDAVLANTKTNTNTNTEKSIDNIETNKQESANLGPGPIETRAPNTGDICNTIHYRWACADGLTRRGKLDVKISYVIVLSCLVRGLVDMPMLIFRAMTIPLWSLFLSYFMSSGALGSPDLLLLYSMITLALHDT